ncbi:MAG: glucosidase [Thermoleophilia bacterium]
MAEPPPTPEHARLTESPGDSDPWRLWGPYTAGRQWGTVREDYSADGDAWLSFPFDHAHLRAYRWGEDGLAGLCDRFGFLHLTVALWNGRDDRIKERLFGLTNHQGNHGEDAKEYWWHLDATPTHSFARWRYRYPHAAFPYQRLVDENAARGRDRPEFELADTGVLAENRFFDVEVTHAKASPTDIVMLVEATNHGPEPADLHVVPQLTFANTWAWGRDDRMPTLRRLDPPRRDDADLRAVEAVHEYLGRYVLACEGAPEVLVCDNETNTRALYDSPGRSEFPRDAINRAVVHGEAGATRPDGTGTRAAFHHVFTGVAPGATVRVRLRLTADEPADRPFDTIDTVLRHRRDEADAFYDRVIPAGVGAPDREVARAAFAGLLWSRQLYRYTVQEWLEGDPAQPAPPPERLRREPAGRNTSWRHLSLTDVISMPDEWEYPWFASWDLAFHTVALAHVDPAFAKAQLLLMCREWAQHPNGQLPAYEWAFSDVNPPVHAWAAWQVYVRDGSWDHAFLSRVMAKLLLNFSWWVNRKDPDGSDLFEGGFLGMDNISAFDRSRDVPAGWRLEQSDATSWMAFSCLSLMRIAQELARHDPAWDDLAGTFLTRFLGIANAMEAFGSGGVSLWDDRDGFFYDALVCDTGEVQPVRVRSLVGLLPILAVANSEPWVERELPEFTRRLAWLRRHRPDLAGALLRGEGEGTTTTLALVEPARLARLLTRMLDEAEFLGACGVRSLSAQYRDGMTLTLGGQDMHIRYTPGVSDIGLFGGNSNWRGPVWFPVNALLLSALRTYARGAGADMRVEFPAGSGHDASLAEVADAVEERLVAVFRPGADGRRPSTPRDHGGGPLWDRPVFSEFFDGDTGEGVGAGHQTGWTALVADMICTRGSGRSPRVTAHDAARGDSARAVTVRVPASVAAGRHPWASAPAAG